MYMSQTHESKIEWITVLVDPDFLQAKLEIQINSLSQPSLITSQVSEVRMITKLPPDPVGF